MTRIQAEKALAREKIQKMRESINRLLKTPAAIPQRIVDGKLSEIVEFKEYANKAVKDYHLKNPPGATISLKRLNEHWAKLERHCQKLGIEL